MKEPEFRKLVRKELIKLSEGLNKKDVSYQLSIDYSGNTKPKVTKLNNKKITIFYGYKTNPKDVIKSLQKLDPSLKIKHTGWKNNSSGGGVHSFIFESKLDESGILYKAGVKKYGKEGMKKIQSAAGKGEGHEEIGKIKDKFEKGKTNEVEEITEANPFRNTKSLKPLLKFGSIVTKKVGEEALLQFSDAFEDLDDEQADDIASHLNMAIELMQDGEIGAATKKLKQFNKVCKDALKRKPTKSAFENVNESVNEASDQQRLTHLRKFGIAPNNQPQNAAYIKQVSKPGKFFVDWKDAFKLGDVALEFVNNGKFDIIDLKTMKRTGKQLDVKKGQLGNLRTTYGVRVNESKLTEAKEDYKYKKQVGKAFDKINDAMFNFRHAFGVKQLTNDNMKLKKKFEALQANIFALQRELRSDGLSEGVLNEIKLKDLPKKLAALDKKKNGELYNEPKITDNGKHGHYLGLTTHAGPNHKKYFTDLIKKLGFKNVEFDGKENNGSTHLYGWIIKEGKLTEAKIKKGDIIKMDDGEYGVVNKVSGRVAYIKLQSSPGSFHPIEAARITYKGKHKGKDLYNESSVRES